MDHMELYIFFIILGGLFIIGLIADVVGHRMRFPRVTLLILIGVFAGPMGLNIIPSQFYSLYEPLATIALTMVAFLLGGSLSREVLSRHGPKILIISLAVIISTIVLVAGGLMALGVAPELALLFSGIATATAPAATLDVIKQTGASGEFVQTLKGIVATDDAWGLIAFSLILASVNIMIGDGSESCLYLVSCLHFLLRDLGGAVLVGIAIGLPAVIITGRLRAGETTQIEALAIVFLCAGASLWLGVSFLLAGIVTGMIVVNFAKHHTRPFSEIENIEWPFMVLFFFLAGVSLQGEFRLDTVLIIVSFTVLRTISRIVGAWTGGYLSKSPRIYRQWMGVAMLPQAGVAIGMALIAAQEFPELSQTILNVTISTTIIFEIFGPIGTLIALKKAGHIK